MHEAATTDITAEVNYPTDEDKARWSRSPEGVCLLPHPCKVCPDKCPTYHFNQTPEQQAIFQRIVDIYNGSNTSDMGEDRAALVERVDALSEIARNQIRNAKRRAARAAARASRSA